MRLPTESPTGYNLVTWQGGANHQLTDESIRTDVNNRFLKKKKGIKFLLPWQPSAIWNQQKCDLLNLCAEWRKQTQKRFEIAQKAN